MSVPLSLKPLWLRFAVYIFDRPLPSFAKAWRGFLFVLISSFSLIGFAAAAADQCTQALTNVPHTSVATRSRNTSLQNYARVVSTDPVAYRTLQAQLTGPLGQVFDVVPDGSGKTNKVANREPEFSQEEKSAREFLKTLPENISPELKAFLQKELSVKAISPNAIMIKVPNARAPRSDFTLKQNLFRTFLFERFSFMAKNLTTWVYQLNGLEPYAAETSGTMYDENVGYQLEGYKPDQFLLFDKAVWNIHQRYIEIIWDRLQKQQITQEELGDLMALHPFLPLSGVVLSEAADGRVEIKRYFKNDFEDPFNLLSLAKKDDFVLRHLLLLRAVEALPSGTALEIHSHSQVHTIAYRKLGFKVDHEESSPLYPGVKIEVLTSTRETMMQKITDLLARLSIAP